MSDQNSAGLGVSGAVPANEPDPQTDQGVAVGAADVEADRARASGENTGPDSDEDYVEQANAEADTDGGVPVGANDAEQDRLNATSDD